MKTMACVLVLGFAGLAGGQHSTPRVSSLEDPREVTVLGLKAEAGCEAMKSFKASNREPLMVADFGGDRVIRRVATTYRGPAARLDFFLFSAGNPPVELKKDANDRLCVDIKCLERLFATAPEDERQPIASILVKRANEPNNLRRFFAPKAGRYLVVTYAYSNRDQGGTGAGSTPLLSFFDAGLTGPSGPTDLDPQIVLPPRDGIPPISR